MFTVILLLFYQMTWAVCVVKPPTTVRVKGSISCVGDVRTRAFLVPKTRRNTASALPQSAPLVRLAGWVMPLEEFCQHITRIVWKFGWKVWIFSRKYIWMLVQLLLTLPGHVEKSAVGQISNLTSVSVLLRETPTRPHNFSAILSQLPVK